MSQQIRCPHCGQTYELTPEQVPQYAGQTITCTSCKQAFTVPRDVAAPAGGAGGAGGAGAGVGASTGTPPYPQQQQPYAQPQQQPYAQHQPGTPPQYPGPGGAGGPVGYGGYQPPPQQQTNGMAIASLVFGIIGLIFPLIPGLIGIILGIVGLNRTKDPRIGGKGLAIAGISVSAVSILLTGCMISILLPSLNRARETANRVKCASHMRQIGQALLLYANDNRRVYPPDFPPLLLPQATSSEFFDCPCSTSTRAHPTSSVRQQSAVRHQHCSYHYLPGLTYHASAQPVIAYEPLTNRAGDGANFLCGDC